MVRDTYGLEEDGIVVLPEVIQCFRGEATKIVNQHKRIMWNHLPRRQRRPKIRLWCDCYEFSFQSIQTLYDNIRHGEYFHYFTCNEHYRDFLALLRTCRKTTESVVRAIGHIESGDFSEQMEVRDNIEVEQISDAINSMLTKVQNLEDSRQNSFLTYHMN